MKYLLLFFCLPLIACETIVQSDEALYNESQVVLIGNVSIESEMGYVESDKAIIDHCREGEKWEASHIKLTGHVRMTNGEKTQFAIAEQVDYFPDQKVMVFESNQKDRVLFYDTEKQMQLSAHKVRAERQEKDVVQGYGDVRFVFGAEELDKFKQQFKW